VFKKRKNTSQKRSRPTKAKGVFGFMKGTSNTPSLADAGARLLSAEELARPVSLIILLVVSITVSALAVIYSSYEYRKLFNSHQSLVSQWDDFQVEWGQLLLEQSAFGANARVERIATENLHMNSPRVQQIEIVRYER
jgi:cell division protein FtsL